MTLNADEAIFRPEGQTLDEVLSDLGMDTPLPESEKEEKENSTDSPAENNQEADTHSSEGDKKEEDSTVLGTSEDTQDDKDEPFHKRWKAQRDKLKSEFDKELDDRLAAQRAEFDERLKEYAPKGTDVQTYPDWVKRIYGEGSQEGLGFYRDWLKEQQAVLASVKAEAKTEFLTEQQRAAQAAQDEKERWQNWVGDQIQELKDDGLKFNVNELQKVALDYMPTDEDGNISFRKAFAIYEKLKAAEADPEKSKARKELAAATTDSKATSSEAKPKTYHTPETLRNMSWSQLPNLE